MISKFDGVYRVRVALNPPESSMTRAVRELENFYQTAYQQSVRSIHEIHAEQKALNPPHLGNKIDILA